MRQALRENGQDVVLLQAPMPTHKICLTWKRPMSESENCQFNLFALPCYKRELTVLDVICGNPPERIILGAAMITYAPHARTDRS